MLLTLMISAKEIAGVSGASLIVIASTVFGVIMVVGHIMDITRSICNVFSN